MNILKRNKEIIKRHDAGETFLAMSKEYGIDAGSMSVTYYAFKNIVDRPCYDIVAGMDIGDQVAVKLVNVLCRYEGMMQVDLDADYLRTMDRQELIKQRGVGKAIMDAFDKMQEVLRNG